MNGIFQCELALKVTELIITLEAMLILDASVTIKAMRWLGQLDCPWTSLAAVSHALPLAELQPVSRYLGRESE